MQSEVEAYKSVLKIILNDTKCIENMKFESNEIERDLRKSLMHKNELMISNVLLIHSDKNKEPCNGN